MEKIYLDQERYYKPINSICRKYNIPFVYDWSYSLHNNMNLLIKVVNGMVIEMWDLKKIINDFIQAFEEDLQETVADILKEWDESGKLEEIINEALFNAKLDKEEFEEYKEEHQKEFEDYVNKEKEKYDGLVITAGELGIKPGNVDMKAFNKIYDLKPYSKVFFPSGDFIFESPVLIPNTIELIGVNKRNTFFSFESNAFHTGDSRLSEFAMKNLTIQNTNKNNIDVGIKLRNYASYFIFENIEVNNFGAWAIEQEGGMDFIIRDVKFKDNGVNVENGGSYKLYKGEGIIKDNVTTAFLENIYARSGGKYAFHFSNISGFSANKLIAEYHDFAFYADNVPVGSIHNFYEETNRNQAKGIAPIYIKNSRINFIAPKITMDIETEWTTAVPYKNRFGVQIGALDIEGRNFKGAGVTLEKSVASEIDKTIAFSNTNPVYFINNEWHDLADVKTGIKNIWYYKKIGNVVIASTLVQNISITKPSGAFFVSDLTKIDLPFKADSSQSRRSFAYSKCRKTYLSNDAIIDEVGSTVNILAFNHASGTPQIDITVIYVME